MRQEYTIKRIGRVELGIDGSDEFYQVQCLTPINKDHLYDLFVEKFYQETYQEAGGYYCKCFEIYLSDYEYNAVVKVEHRYDV